MTELLRPIVLVGPPAAGKSAVGRLAATHAGLPFIDVDERVTEREGRDPTEILRTGGEAAFRVAELGALKAALDDSPPSLIAAGSGIVTTAEGRELLRRRARVVLLDVTPACALERLAADPHERPLLQAPAEGTSEARWRALVDGRRRCWEALTQEHFDTTHLSKDAAALTLVDVIRRHDRPVTADLSLLASVRFVEGDLQPPTAGAPPHVLVVDDGLPESDALRALAHGYGGGPVLRVPAGEAGKTLEHAGRLAQLLVDQRLPPDGILVAVGGGAVLDLCGFVAATLYRGVRWVAVPTTLLAMADACLGGKTAVNLPSGKNLVGAFHEPSTVVVDPRFLDSLPPRQRVAGAVEMLKHAFLAADAPDDGSAAHDDEGIPLLARGAAPPDVVTRLLKRSLALKAGVTTADPRERGLRAVLNLGHTLGHALEHEAALARAPLLHGEAVAYGLRFTLELSRERCGLDDDVTRALLARVHELAVPAAPQVPAGRLLARMSVDKKRRSGGLRFVGLAGPGRPALIRDVPDDVIARCIQRAL